MSHDDCKFEEKIIKMCEDVAAIKERTVAIDKRINGSIDEIQHHIEHGAKWRIAIVSACIGLIGLLITRCIEWGKFDTKIAYCEQNLKLLTDIALDKGLNERKTHTQPLP